MIKKLTEKLVITAVCTVAGYYIHKALERRDA